MLPLNTLLPTPPRVSVLPPRDTFEPVTPASEPMLWLPPALMSKLVPALARVTAPAGDRLPPRPIASVPALMVVPPVKVLVPVRVWVPVPSLISPPVPANEPPKVPLVASPIVSVFAPRFTVPLPISVPNCCVPAPADRSKVAPAARLTMPLACRLAPAPSANVPALMLVPPV